MGSLRKLAENGRLVEQRCVLQGWKGGAPGGRLGGVEVNGDDRLPVIGFGALLIPAFFNIGTLLMTPSRLLFLLMIPLLLLKLLYI